MTHPSQPLSNSRHFSHEAMNTTFTMRLHGIDEKSANELARECFECIDTLESHLSRYIENSEISRINHLPAGETLYISESTHECLLLAIQAHGLTGGLFDITLGARIEHQKSGDPGPPPSITGSLVVHPDVAAVTCIEPGRQLDLGGIGKGFALDQLKHILTDRGIEDALVTAGASSLLAIGPSAWPVDLKASVQSLRIQLTNESLSASGTSLQGSHIVHPAGDALPANQRATRIWVQAPSATLAEIWSTAFMLIDPSEIPEIIAENTEITAVHVEIEGNVETITAPGKC